jgi:uncharacterized membrane protein YhhN
MKAIIQKWGITFFILLLSLHLYGQILGEKFTYLQFVTKALLLPTLIGYLMAQEDFAKAPKSKWLIILALFGSFLGDVLLTYPQYFILGMVAFMTTHIFNMMMFHKINGIGQPKSKKFLLFTVVLIAFCVLIYFKLQNAMGSLIYPILVYMVLICSAALMAIHAGANEKEALISKLFWFPGMLFFISSDTVLAFNKFDWAKNMPIKNIGLVTMLTYGLAQVLLTKGFQLYLKQKSNTPN